MSYRNKDLLRVVHFLPCFVCLDGVCEGGNGEPAHSNQQRHGKGFGNKADDVFIASACRSCHMEIDQGKSMSKEQRRDVWQRAHERTLVALWERGLVGVLADKGNYHG